MDILAVVLALFALASPASGYSAGAPSGVCDTMAPNHGVTAQTAAAPYSLTVSSVTNGCGIDSISVTLMGTGGATFKGFLCQARSAVDSVTTVEHFPTTTQPSRSQTIVARCSVVQTKSTYWVKAVNAHVSPCSSAARVTLAFLVSVGVLFAYVI